MKKRTHTKRSSAKKSTKRTVRYGSQTSFSLPFSFRRIILITTCIALFIVGYAIISGKGTQSVAGISITNGLFAQSIIDMPKTEGAVSYNIYYKEVSEGSYKNTVREIPTTVRQYTISYLTKNAKYVYKVVAVNASGAEFWFSDEKPLDNLQSM